MTYRQTLDYLYAQYPVFQRIGAAAYKPDLQNTQALLSICGNPEKHFRSLHIAGTNGKGSVSHMLASILMEAGYKVGLYTSPHLKDFRERIKINGKMISRKFVVDFTAQHKEKINRIRPSFFEVTVAMAFSYFAEKKVDVVVVETGLGGRLDSTNVILPDLSIITNISKDHTQFLGDTFEKIAFEKAGIIKAKVPVIIGETLPETKIVFDQIAKQQSSPILFAERNTLHKKYPCELKGDYQPKNIRTVVTAVQQLQKLKWKISEANIRKGIARVISNTGLHGRWETISKHPHIICDIGHNEAGIREVVKQLRKEKYNHLHMVIGVVNDKDVTAMLQQLPKKAQYYFTKAKIPRALPETELSEKASEFGLHGSSFPSVRKAINAAKKNAGKKDLIFVGGSAFVVAEAL
jgi:dihydrofolate synthase/folylpolyglutamate synthase